jgi:hypothetical protein
VSLGCAASRVFSLSAAGATFDIEHLFTAPAYDDTARALAALRDPWEWYIARADEGLGGRNPWDFAHAVVSEGLSRAGVTPDLIEPRAACCGTKVESYAVTKASMSDSGVFS